MLSDYLVDKTCYSKKQTTLLKKLKSFYSANIKPDIKYCDWLCSVADNLNIKKEEARHLADILYVEAYRNIHDMMITEASISNENLAKCKHTLNNWLTELDKDDTNSCYALNQANEINETVINYCLERVDLDSSQQKVSGSQYCRLAENIFNYIVCDTDESFLKEIMNSDKIFTLFERLDRSILIESLLSQRMKVIKANAILSK